MFRPDTSARRPYRDLKYEAPGSVGTDEGLTCLLRASRLRRIQAVPIPCTQGMVPGTPALSLVRPYQDANLWAQGPRNVNLNPGAKAQNPYPQEAELRMGRGRS
jgi:hypothetical protein